MKKQAIMFVAKALHSVLWKEKYVHSFWPFDQTLDKFIVLEMLYIQINHNM